MEGRYNIGARPLYPSGLDLIALSVMLNTLLVTSEYFKVVEEIG